MARWQVDAAVIEAFALSPKMSDLEVARRIACSALGHQSLRGSNPDVRECLLASELRADV